ncbi:MAG: ATP-grasp domain-containing protein [Lachnospiraceae bacterium]|nr:ATP-grasp domain-containing protein [Lachnospiraceae bacterium]
MEDRSKFNGLRVLLLDGYGRQIPSILQQLHELGCCVTTVNDSKLDVGYCSRYPKYKIVVPGIKENRSLLENFIKEEVTSGKYDVVFPMLEKATDILTENRDYYSQFSKIIAAPREAFIQAYNKQETMQKCMEIGIPCPLTKRDSESLEEYLANVNFPLALKLRKGTGSIGFLCVNDEQELLELINTKRINLEEYVLQEYISGFQSLYSAYILLDQNGTVKTAVSGETTRWFPVDGGPGCFLECKYNKDIIDYSIKLLRKLNWVGFAHLSYIIDPLSGQPKLMEINGRIPAGIKVCSLVGAKPVLQLLELAYDDEVSDFSHCQNDGVCLRYFHTDILWLMKSKNRFHTNPAWFNFKKNHDYIFSWKDPLPFFGYGISHLLNLQSDMKKRNRKL